MLNLKEQVFHTPAPEIQKLALHDSFYKLFYENIPDNFLIVGYDRRIINFNQNVAKSMGYTPEDLKNLYTYDDLLTPASREKCEAIRAQYQQSGYIKNLELEVIKKNGDTIPVMLNSASVKDMEGHVLCHLIVWHDIRELVNARNKIEVQTVELEQKCQELQVRNDDLNTFAHILIHDLKAPLRALNFFSNALNRDSENSFSAESEQHLSAIIEKLRHMEHLINEVFAYFFQKTTHDQCEAAQWSELFNEVLSTILIPDGFQIKDEVRLSGISTRKILLQQVLHNLITNAIKHHHNPAQGIIRLSCQEINKVYHFKVQDNGPGIPADHCEEIFRPLKKMPHHNENDSTGLGLAIVKKIIHQQGGVIKVLPSSDKGSTFVFTWPMKS